MQLWEYCSLRQTEQGLVYTLYRARRYTITLVSQKEDSETVLASYRTRLELLGWKTMQSTAGDGDERLHFKRLLRAENHELSVLGQPVKHKSAVSGSCKNTSRALTSSGEGKLLLSPGSNDVKVRFF